MGYEKIRYEFGCVGIVTVEADELRRPSRQWPEQQRVDEREHRAVGADAQREHEDDDGAESRRAARHPDRIPQVLKNGIHPGESALVPIGLDRLRDAAEIAQRCRPRVGG